MAETIGRFKRITIAEAKQRNGLSGLDSVFILEMTEVLSALQEPDAAFERELEAGERFRTAKARILRFATAMNVADIQVAKGKRDSKETLKVWREKKVKRAQPKRGRSLTQDPAEAQDAFAAAVPEATIGAPGDNGHGEAGVQRRRRRHG